MAAPPDWTTLRIFLAALELGSVTRAADRCGIATSAAAKRIQDLEADCGVLLLERAARGVRPTPAGEAFARHGRALLDLAARLADDLRAFAAGGLGSVRLHVTASAIAGHRLAEALAEFAAERPGRHCHFVRLWPKGIGWTKLAGCRPSLPPTPATASQPRSSTMLSGFITCSA